MNAIEAIREGLQTGDFILYAAKTDDNGFVYEDKVMHHAGDRITLDIFLSLPYIDRLQRKIFQPIGRCIVSCIIYLKKRLFRVSIK